MKDQIDPLIIVAIIGIEPTMEQGLQTLVFASIRRPLKFHKEGHGQQKRCLSSLFIVKKKE